eukprot:TRINITY_DN6888_c0_g1_i1.p1 TRINITY_DN6888_c0_g1~~TRINITY_DN6888_c0_g1_i1.p1  ORF type:complete len:630 (-),score=141.34 TRINITY_DN6888_c0_g1_i1:198-2087(-)
MAKTLNATVICPYFALDEGEIPLTKGAAVTILKQADGGFWLGRSGDKEGYFPFTCVKVSETTEVSSGVDTPPRSTSPIPDSGSLYRLPSELGVLNRKVERLERELRKARERNDDSDILMKEVERAVKTESAARQAELQRSERLAAAVAVLKREAERAMSAREEASQALRVSTHEVANLKTALKNEQRAHAITREELERGRRVALPNGLEDRDPDDRRRLVFSPDRFICQTYAPDTYDRTAYEDPSWNKGHTNIVDDPDEDRLDFLYEDETPVDGVLRILLAAWISRLRSNSNDLSSDAPSGLLSCVDCVLVFETLCTEIGLPCPWFGYGSIDRAAALMRRTMRGMHPRHPEGCRVVELIAALLRPPWTLHVPTAIAPLLQEALRDELELGEEGFEQVGLFTNRWVCADHAAEGHTARLVVDTAMPELSLEALEEPLLSVCTPQGEPVLLVHSCPPPELELVVELSPIATLEVQLLASTEAHERVLDAQASAQQAEMLLVQAAYDVEADTLASPTTSPTRSRSWSVEASEILDLAREAVLELLGDGECTELDQRAVEDLVLSVWMAMGSHEPRPEVSGIAGMMLEEFGDGGIVVLDEYVVDPVLHHILSHVTLGAMDEEDLDEHVIVEGD